jgi:hypothetical protein
MTLTVGLCIYASLLILVLLFCQGCGDQQPVKYESKR